MLGYCTFNLPWLIPPDTIHSFIKISNQHNKKQNLLTADQSVAICIFRIPLVLKKFWKLTTVWRICVEISSKKNQLKSSYRKKWKIFSWAESFCLFQHDQTIIPKTNHNCFAWHKRKNKHKKHNHNRMMKVWKTQNRKKKDRFVGLPPNKRFCLTPLARHSMMLSQKTRIEAQREHHKACENHI